jgi:hypothetical protein
MWGYRIYDVLLHLFLQADLGVFTNYSQWKTEIDEWNSDAKLYGVLHTPNKFEATINDILSHYMIDMWLDQSSQLLVVSAVSAWKNSKRQLTEGNDFSNLKTTTLARERYSRAMIYSHKEYKTDNKDPVNYSKLILRTDLEKEHLDFYGDIKLKEFKPSEFMSNGDAVSLCQRYIQRFSDAPKQITFTMEERKLANTKLGDVVEVISRDSQTAEGLYLTSKERVQITRIQPVLNKVGRMYNITSLSYAPLIASNPNDELTITLSGSLADVNLFAEAGKPNLALNVTFVFDGATIGSTSASFYSITAYGFVVGSRVRVILINGCRWSAKGGKGGDSYAAANVSGGVASASGGGNGGNMLDSGGVECHVYINYAVDQYVCSSEAVAAGGGGGGSAAYHVATGLIVLSGNYHYTGTAVSRASVSGSGGSGIPGGDAGTATGENALTGWTGAIDRGGEHANNGQSDSQLLLSADDSNNPGVRVRCLSSVLGGGGGLSAGGERSESFTESLVTDEDASVIDVKRTEISAFGGLAGYAFVGANITVYNTDPSKLRDGRNNGAGYTLVSV